MPDGVDVTLTIHPHPALSEIFMESADLFWGTATHSHRQKRKFPPILWKIQTGPEIPAPFFQLTAASSEA